jgi:hypothetical protein
VVLTRTAESRPDELHRRLRRYLSQPSIGLSPDIAEDPEPLVRVLLERQQTALWPRWPQWLHRLVHG